MACVGHGAVRVRLDVTDVQAGMLLRAAGARRFAFNWAVARIKANADQWQAEASYGISKADRIKPLSYFTLGKLCTAERPEVAPWGPSISPGRSGTRCATRRSRTRHSSPESGGFPKVKAPHANRP